MIFLARILGLVALWAVGRWRRKSAPPQVIAVEGLSWASKVRLSWRLVRDKRISTLARGIAFLPVLYLTSPLDLIPDFIPFVGRLDDALVFSVLVDLFIRSVPPTILDEHLARDSA